MPPATKKKRKRGRPPKDTGPTLTVKLPVPASLHEALKATAERERRTMRAQILQILEASMAERRKA